MSEGPVSIDAGREHEAGVAVGRLYATHARPLYGLCRMLLRDPHDAEDALQETFLSAHRALARGGGPRDEGAWLAAIARNECRARIRARMSRPLDVPGGVPEWLADPTPAPGELLPDTAVRKALAQLPETQREAVVLHDVVGLRAREVGRVLGISVPAVEALLFRGRRQLRLRLRPVHGLAVVPPGVSDGLAQLIPGFLASESGAAAGGAGVAGIGLLAKLTAGPATSKAVVGLVGVAVAGSVAVVGGERLADDRRGPAVRPPVVSTDELREAGPRASGTAGGRSAQDDGRGRGDDDARAPRGDETRADDDRSDSNRSRGGGSSGPGSSSEGSRDDHRGSGGDAASETETETETARSGEAAGESDSSLDDDEGGDGSGTSETGSEGETSDGSESGSSDSTSSVPGSSSGSDDAVRDDSSGSGSGSGKSGSSGSSGSGSGSSGSDDPDEPDD